MPFHCDLQLAKTHYSATIPIKIIIQCFSDNFSISKTFFGFIIPSFQLFICWGCWGVTCKLFKRYEHLPDRILIKVFMYFTALFSFLGRVIAKKQYPMVNFKSIVNNFIPYCILIQSEMNYTLGNELNTNVRIKSIFSFLHLEEA